MYDLYGVVVHHGSSASSGHYFAFVKAPNSAWYCMNDDSVSKAGWNLVQQQQAYMLFYSRRPAASMGRVMPPPANSLSSSAIEAVLPPQAADRPPQRQGCALVSPVPSDQDLEVERLATVQWKPAPLISSSQPLTFAPSSKLMLLEESRFGPALMLAASQGRARIDSVASAASCPSVWRDRKRSLASYKVISASTICYPKSARDKWDCLAIYSAFSKQHYHPTDEETDNLCAISEHNGWGTLADNRRAAAKQAKRARLDVLTSDRAFGSSESESTCTESDEVATEFARPAKKARIIPDEVDTKRQAELDLHQKPTPAPIHSQQALQARNKREKQLEGVTVARSQKGKAFNPSTVASFSSLTNGAGWESKGWGEAGHWSLSNIPIPTSHPVSAGAPRAHASTKYPTTGYTEEVRYPDEEEAAAMTDADWTALLDTGRVKKVKAPVAEGDRSLASSFQSNFTKQYIESAPLQDGKGYRKGFQPPHTVFYPAARK
jgi:hypothetical protein